MNSTAIKLEPGTSVEESVPVMLTEIDVEYPFIKKECPESISGNNLGEISTTKHFNLEGVTIKAEPETREGEEIEISCTEIGIDLPDIKMKGMEHSEGIHQTAGAAFGGRKILFAQHHAGKDFDRSQTFPCSKCDKKFLSKPGLMAHLLTHTKENPFSCSYCKYSCLWKSHLTRHMRTHTKEKPFACSYCNYSCLQKSNLITHIRTHTKEKPFSCSYCSYSCSRNSDLTRHIKLTHSKEKPFSCYNCNYSCSDKSYLMRHIRTHAKEKPYSCSYCNYSCLNKSHLTRHKLTHNKENPFSCSY